MGRRWKVSNNQNDKEFNPPMQNHSGQYALDAMKEPHVKLRDHFAGLAMQGILSSMSESRYNGFGYSAEELASECYTVADAMLKARKEVEP